MRQPINITTITPPAETPVSYTLVMDHMRVDGDEERELILQMIAAATEHAESEMQRSLVNRTLNAEYGKGPADRSHWLPRGPVSVITTVGGEAASGVSLTRMGGRDIALFDNGAAPAGPTSIEYVAGYGDAEAVPADIKQGILMHVAHLWKHRESTASAPTHEVAHGLSAIYDRHRIGGVV